VAFFLEKTREERGKEENEDVPRQKLHGDMKIDEN